MNKNIYSGLALVACLSIASAPLFAEVSLALEHPANIIASATSITEHQAAVELHKKQAAYHKAMVEHYKSLIAAEYEKGGQVALNKHFEVMATHHEPLSREHQKVAETHETMVKAK